MTAKYTPTMADVATAISVALVTVQNLRGGDIEYEYIVAGHAAGLRFLAEQGADQ